MSTKTPGSWASDPQVRSLRVEISAERSLLLPFDQFTFSELTGEGKEQHLRLVFATHEVVICGYALRRLETIMQRMELSFIAKATDGQLSLATEGQPVILEITVNPVNPTGSTAQNSEN